MNKWLAAVICRLFSHTWTKWELAEFPSVREHIARTGHAANLHKPQTFACGHTRRTA